MSEKNCNLAVQPSEFAAGVQRTLQIVDPKVSLSLESYVSPVQLTSSVPRGEFRPRQTRQLPRAVDLKGRLLNCQSY